MLPQPFVTTAQAQSENLRVALDLTEEWDALQADSDTPSTLVTGVVVARTEFVEEHPEAISTSWTTTSSPWSMSTPCGGCSTAGGPV